MRRKTMNKVILTGNLVKDVEVKVINGTDRHVIQNAIAVKRNYKNKQGQYDSDFITIVIYDPQCNFVSNYVKKGDKIAVSGRWQHRKYTDQNDNNKYIDELVVDSIELLAKPQNRQDNNNYQNNNQQYNNQQKTSNSDYESHTIDDLASEDDLPFY